MKNIKNARVLVTGGAGFIGSHIVERLLNEGAVKVRVLDNLSTGNYDNIRPFERFPGFEFMEGDIRKLPDCEKACRDISAISHQAALGSVPRSLKDPANTNTVNVGGFVNMLQAAQTAGIKRFVYASSSSVYGNEPNLPKVEERIGRQLSPYAVSKYANEVYANVFGLCYDMQLMGFRYFNVFGPRQSPKGPYAAVIPLFINALRNNLPVYINGDGEQSRDFTYVDNAVQANLLALFTENAGACNQVYNVAVGQRFTVNELYAAIARHLQSDRQATHRAPRPGDVRHSLANIEKAKQLLGYRPSVNFEDGLLRTVEAFMKLV